MTAFFFYYALLVFIVNIYGLFLWKTNKSSSTIANAFQKMLDESNRIPNKIWVDKVVNFTTYQWNHGYKITKENLLLLKDLLEP